MLVLLTAAMEPAVTPGAASTSRMQAQMLDQFASVSNTCEPGYSGREGCDHSRCAMASCVPSGAKTTARQLPVPASMASRYSPLTRALPDSAGPCRHPILYLRGIVPAARPGSPRQAGLLRGWL